MVVEVKREGVILESTDNEFERQAVCNPGCVRVGGKVKMFYRAIRENNYSSIGYCELDGPLNVVERFDEPVITGESEYDSHGVEDPRVIFFEDKYYIFYVAYDGKNALIEYATSKDLVKFEKKGVISPRIRYSEAKKLFMKSKLYLKDKYFFFETYFRDVNGEDILLWEKDAFIFPKRINGKMAFVHRVLPDMQIAYINNLSELTTDYWRDHLSNISNHLLLGSKYWYESRHIGGGPPPIETDEGWLTVYHAVEDSEAGRIYHASAALLDKDNPQKVIGRLKDPLISPQMEWEQQGEVNNVVFPTGAAEFDGRLYLYYGAADKRIAVASVNIDELLDELKNSQHYTHVISEIGHTAGQVYDAGINQPVKLEDLVKIFGKDEKLVLMALGWLAREDKMDYIKLGKEMKFKVKK
ncbi:MAG: winged helix-turn-helix domain-containing protein [Candidatus Altiarchaeota archaeon]